MARKKVPAAEQVQATETILIWKAKAPLSDIEHEQLSQKCRYEQEQSGIPIVLVPHSVDVEVVQVTQTGAGEVKEDEPKAPDSVGDDQ